MKNFSEIYKYEIDQSIKVFDQIPLEDVTTYASWVAQTYHFVKYSTRLLALAAGTASLEESLFHERFLEHLKEETGHEKLALQDIKACGFSIEQFPEMPEIQQFYSDQFEILKSHGPSVFMGWIIFLEGLACEYGAKMSQKCALHEAKRTRFLRTHAEEDVEHIESAFELVNASDTLNNPQFIENFVSSSRLYREMLLKILEEAKNRTPDLMAS